MLESPMFYIFNEIEYIYASVRKWKRWSMRFFWCPNHFLILSYLVRGSLICILLEYWLVISYHVTVDFPNAQIEYNKQGRKWYHFMSSFSRPPHLESDSQILLLSLGYELLLFSEGK